MLLPLSAIKVIEGRNPRTYFDDAAMAELKESVRVKGVIQSILVRPSNDKAGTYELIAGERRFRAASAVYDSEWLIPALVRHCTGAEAEVLASLENTERAQMSATDEAAAAHRVFVRLKGDKTETLAELGWDSMTKLDRRLALMTLIPEVRLALTQGRIKVGHAELLVGIAQSKQLGVLEKVIEHGVSVDQLKQQVGAMAHDLGKAIFDKTQCATCPHSSVQQRALFAEAIQSGSCTNPPCYQAKTEAHLEGVRAALAEEVPKVILLRKESDVVTIKLCADGMTGVGQEQK